MSYAFGATKADPWATPGGGSSWFPMSSWVSCPSMGMVSDPSNPYMCNLSNGKLPAVKVPVTLAPMVWWGAITCTLRGGYPRSTGFGDEFRVGDQVACCRENADLFCDSWM